MGNAYLILKVQAIIVTVQVIVVANIDTTVTALDTSPLGKVLFTLLSANLDLLLLTTTAELIRLEGVGRLELSATVLGDISRRHGEGIILSGESME